VLNRSRNSDAFHDKRADTSDAGWRLRRVRERLRLKYREVKQASDRIAEIHGNSEFRIGLSRLADIENKGTVPSIYRLYSLCSIYGLDLSTVLKWYGVEPEHVAAEAAHVQLETTRLLSVNAQECTVELPANITHALETGKTSYVAQQACRWGKLPLSLLDSLDNRKHSYALVGSADWSMHPLIPPGSFIQIDESRRKIVNQGWAYDFDRPIYFIEARRAYLCRWCVEVEGTLIAQPHPASQELPQVLKLGDEAEVMGQVVGVAMRLDLGKRSRIRS
jgi:transcriptional regulator with XRE-family HTH domain